jgi:hypothetical protein
LWTPTATLPVRASHPFYQRLNQIHDEKKFDEYVETVCEDFYAREVGAGLSPGDLLSAADGGLFRSDRFRSRNRMSSTPIPASCSIRRMSSHASCACPAMSRGSFLSANNSGAPEVCG